MVSESVSMICTVSSRKKTEERNKGEKPFQRVENMSDAPENPSCKVILRNDVPSGRAMVTAPPMPVSMVGPLFLFSIS